MVEVKAKTPEEKLDEYFLVGKYEDPEIVEHMPEWWKTLRDYYLSRKKAV